MRRAIISALICLAGIAQAQPPTPAEYEARGITFHASYDEGVTATWARGNPEPTALVNARIVSGRVGQAVLTQRDKETQLGKVEGRATSLNYDATGHLFGERGTVAFWFQPLYDLDDPEIRSGSNSTGPYLVNVSSVEDSYYQQFIRTNIKGGAFYIWVVDRDGGQHGPNYTEGIETWKSGEWRHLVITWDAAQGVRFYDNGVLKYSTWGERPFPPATPLGIGVGGTAPVDRAGWTTAADSAYDELVLLDRSVSAEEVIALMEGRLGDLQPSPPFAYSGAQLDERRRAFLIEDDPARLTVIAEDGVAAATIAALQPTEIGVRYITRAHLADGRFEPSVRFEQGGVVMPREATFALVGGARANYAVIVGEPPEGSAFSLAGEDVTLTTTAAGAARSELPDLAQPRLAIPGRATVGEVQLFRVTEGAPAGAMTTWRLAAEGAAQDLASPREAPEGLEAPWEDYPEIVAHITEQQAPLLRKLDPEDRRLLLPGEGEAPAHEVKPTRHLYLAGEPMAADTCVSALRLRLPLSTEATSQVFRLTVPHPYEPSAFYASADLQVRWEDTGGMLDLTIEAPGMIFPQGSRPLVEIVSSEAFTLAGTPELSARIVPAEVEGESFARQYNRLINEDFTSQMGVNFVHYLRGLVRDDPLTRGVFRAIYFDPDNDLAWNMARWAKYRPWPAWEEEPGGPQEFPLVARYAREAALSARDTIHWWIDERQDESGYVVGRADMWNDDTKLFNEYSFLWLLSGDERLAEAMERYLAAHWASGRMLNGWSRPFTDAVHSAEEASYLEPTMALVRYGDPLHIEQIMQTASNIDYWTGVTDGHRHFRSNYFTAEEMKTDGHFGHDVGLCATAMVSSMWLAWYNGHPAASQHLTEWMEAWVEDTMAEAPSKPAGEIPSWVDFASHEVGPAEEVYLAEITMMMDAARQLTGDERYAEPLVGYLRRQHPRWLQIVNQATTDLRADIGPGEWDRLLLAGADDRLQRIANDEFFQRGLAYEEIPGLLGWQITGEERYLEATCFNAWRNNARAYPLYTGVDAHKDRVYPWGRYILPWMYCGGNALNGRGSAPWPTIAVTWDAGYDFAALVRENEPEQLRISAWNFGDVREVGLRTWSLQPGLWRVTVAGGAPREVRVERGARVPVALPARAEAEILLELVEADTSWSPARADLALSATEGARIANGTLMVIAHNIGSLNSPACMATLSRNGKVIAEAQVPPIAAPLDFLPKTAEVRFSLPAGLDGEVTVALDSANTVPEVTELNNTLRASATQ